MSKSTTPIVKKLRSTLELLIGSLKRLGEGRMVQGKYLSTLFRERAELQHLFWLI